MRKAAFVVTGSMFTNGSIPSCRVLSMKFWLVSDASQSFMRRTQRTPLSMDYASVLGRSQMGKSGFRFQIFLRKEL